MPLPASTLLACTLHAHPHLGYTSTLVYTFAAGAAARVELSVAVTSLLLAVLACRAKDERDGKTEKVGHRSLEYLGRALAVMPAHGNPVSARAVQDYKRRIGLRISRALEALSPVDGQRLHVPHPIANHGHGQGYCLEGAGMELTGVSISDLLDALDELDREERWH